MTQNSLWLCVYLPRYLYGIRLGSSKECWRGSPGFLSKASSWSRAGIWDFPYFFKGETTPIFDFVSVAPIYFLDYVDFLMFFFSWKEHKFPKLPWSRKWSLWVRLLVHVHWFVVGITQAKIKSKKIIQDFTKFGEE